jgi:hypothetical protein
MSVIDYKLKQNIDTLIDSSFENPFKDKWVSIIGDSISTFKGWTNSSNVYYSESTGNSNNVKTVEDTWWHILLKKLGAKLCVNQSIAGSRIYNSSDESDRLLTRINNREYVRKVGQKYKNLDGSEEVCETEVVPDYVIIFMGINDWQSESNIGIKYTKITGTDDKEYKLRIPFTVTNLNTLNSDSDWANSTLGQYRKSLLKLVDTIGNSGRYIRVITITPTFCKSSNGVWRLGNSSNEGMDDFLDCMKECSVNHLNQPIIDTRNWVRYYTSEWVDSSYCHPTKRSMMMIADGAYKQLMNLAILPILKS